MHVRFLLLYFLLFTSFASGLAQGIHGRVINEHNEPVAYANVYVPELSTGTTSNVDGIYELKLPEGNWKVLFQYLGYQTQTHEINLTNSFQEINVQLISRNIQIPEIKVLASGEDPAYYIMRRAIAMAPYYRRQVSKYSCKVYLKGSGVFEKIPFLFKKQLKKSGLKEDQPFVMETVSQIDFELPDQLKQKVLAMRSSGQQNNTSPMGMITNNLYDAEKYGVVSPVGISALKAYKFRLDGVFEDQGRTINKIRVIPKVNGNDVFSGYIYIADLFWNIHSADLELHIPMTDVKVHQLYGEVNKNTWMPVSLDFDMDFSGLGLKMKYRYVASISDYKTTINPVLDHSFLDKLNKQQLDEQELVEKITAENSTPKPTVETKTSSVKRIEALMEKPELTNHETRKLNRLMGEETRRTSPPEPLEIKSSMVVSQKQVNNDSAFWNTLRPIPLTPAEKQSFNLKETYLKKSSTSEFQDSVRDSKRKFKLKHLIFGKTYNYSTDSIREYRHFSIPGLTDPTSLSFNSVDGLRLELPFSYTKSDSTGQFTRFSPNLAYAFGRKKLDAGFSIDHRMNGLKNSWISVGLGSATSNYNRTSGLSSVTNDFYTLWMEQNFNRYYRRDYIRISTSRDLVNGLNLNVGADYSNNMQLQNHSHYSFLKYGDREIQPNIPVNNTLAEGQLADHQSLIGRIALEYTPHHRYFVRNNVKVYVNSKFPTYSLVYLRAFSGIFGTTSRYDLLKIGMYQKIDFGIDDHFSYILNAGKFLNSQEIYFEDFQHFNVKSTGFMFSSYENSFRLLPFYAYSTSDRFADAHASWQTRRLIFKQLPIIRNSSVSENLFLNFLSTPKIRNYVETGYGLQNLFLLLNVEAVAGFENGKFRSAGVKVSLNLK